MLTPSNRSTGIVAAWTVVATLLAGAGGSRAEEPAGQPVQLPYIIRDNTGGQWTIQPDGSIELAGRHFHNGGHLQIGDGEGYQPEGNQAKWDAGRGELVLPAVAVAGLNVSRRVQVKTDPTSGWCRYVEVLENPGAAPVRVQLHLAFSPGGPFQATQPLVDERKGRGAGNRTIGLAVFDGDDGVAMVGAGRGSRLVPRITPQPENGVVELVYDVEVPARQTVAVVHLQIHRGNYNECIDFAKKTRDRDYLRDLPKQLVQRVANFRTGGQFVGDVEILRGGVQDVVELRGGDQYKGTLADKTFKLATAFGPVEVPAERVVSVLTAGQFRPSQLLVLADGQVLGGALQAETVRLQLSTGQTTSVPLRDVTRIGLRRRAGEPDEWKLEGRPMAFLRDGQRFGVQVPAEPLPVATRYGLLNLKPATVASVTLQGEDQAVHVIELTDGSRFAGLVAKEAFELKPAGWEAAGGVVRLPLAAVSRVQFGTNAAKEKEGETSDAPSDDPKLALTNGDLLVGSLAGKLVLETTFDAIEINAAEVRSLRHGTPSGADAGDGGATTVASPSEVQVSLWDDATFSGRLRGDTLECRLKCGETLRVPVALVEQYAQPNPEPPPAIAERARALVKDLGAADWRQRDRATAELLEIGPVAAGVLKAARGNQPPEGQARIDELLAKFEAMRKPKVATPAPLEPPAPGAPPVDGDEAPNPPARAIRERG